MPAVAPANFADWQRMNTVFAGIAAFVGTNAKGAGYSAMSFSPVTASPSG